MIDLEVLTQAIGDLDENLVIKILEEFIKQNPNRSDAQNVITACQKGMEVVGKNFEKGDYYVGDLIFAGELLSTSIDMIKPLIGDEDGTSKSIIVLGTVKGDIHDIGKNIFKSMCEAAGFKVIDLGIDQAPEAFVSAVKENDAQIVGFSGVLTLSIESMKTTIEAFKTAGLRDKVKITIGGNAVNEEACEYVGADAWSKNAAEAVKMCNDWADNV